MQCIRGECQRSGHEPCRPTGPDTAANTMRLGISMEALRAASKSIKRQWKPAVDPSALRHSAGQLIAAANGGPMPPSVIAIGSFEPRIARTLAHTYSCSVSSAPAHWPEVAMDALLTLLAMDATPRGVLQLCEMGRRFVFC